MGKKKKWIKPRHRIITDIARIVLSPYVKWKYKIKIDKFKEQGKRAYLVLLNHQTAFDQFFIGISFSGPVYYLATEDIFSMGFVSKLLKWAVEPIPIKKQTTDVAAVMNCIRVSREGGTLCIAPEGNRTYSGKTEYMSKAIVPLAKKLGLPIALYRIEGGYGAQPRWSDVVRKGKMHAYVSKVIEPEEYKTLSDDELFDIISEGLYVDEAVADMEFHHKNRAEYLERAIYVCPYCGLSEFESHEDMVECKKCGRKITYEPNKEIKGIGFDFPFGFVSEWYDYQKDFVNSLDTNDYIESPLYRDTADVSEVIVYSHKEKLRKDAGIALYGDRIVVDEGREDEIVWPFSEVTAVSVLGRNKLNVYHDKRVFQFKGSKRFNALKYVNIYYRHKNISKGDIDGKFLGL